MLGFFVAGTRGAVLRIMHDMDNYLVLSTSGIYQGGSTWRGLTLTKISEQGKNR